MPQKKKEKPCPCYGIVKNFFIIFEGPQSIEFNFNTTISSKTWKGNEIKAIKDFNKYDNLLNTWGGQYTCVLRWSIHWDTLNFQNLEEKEWTYHLTVKCQHFIRWTSLRSRKCLDKTWIKWIIKLRNFLAWENVSVRVETVGEGGERIHGCQNTAFPREHKQLTNKDNSPGWLKG